MTLRRFRKSELRPAMEYKHRGARAELVACAWLLERGYEVFRNISQHGEIDVVALKDGKTFYFDIKSSEMRERRERFSRRAIDAGVLPLYVFNDKIEIDYNPQLKLTEPELSRPCIVCGKSYRRKAPHQKFCDVVCQVRNYDARKKAAAVNGGAS